MNLAQITQSHALSFFHLSSPDFLLGWESDPNQRNIFGLIAANPELARSGIRLRQFGQGVIEALGGGERCVCDLTGELGLAQSKLSFHLKVLREAGLIEAREQGRWIYYRLRSEALLDLEHWLAGLACWAYWAGCCWRQWAFRCWRA
jgi:DNA-binding transcriptional ArsR family regulator